MTKIIQILVLSLSVLFYNNVMAEPTVKEIYQTLQTDKNQALSMINEVINNHPNSSKAYFIKTEILLAMGKKGLAKESFIKSEKLDPTFGYAKSESVTRVRNALGIKPKSESMSNENILIVGGIILAGILIIWLIVRRREPQTPTYMPNNYNRPITPFHPAPVNTNATVGGTGGTTGGGTTSGSSSGIMGSLATGVAVGAGAVAGAALANHLINGNNSNSPSYRPDNQSSSYTPDSDFGVSDSDSGSWDSGSSSDSSDW